MSSSERYECGSHNLGAQCPQAFEEEKARKAAALERARRLGLQLVSCCCGQPVDWLITSIVSRLNPQGQGGCSKRPRPHRCHTGQSLAIASGHC